MKTIRKLLEYTTPVDADIFESEKKIQIQNFPDMCGRGLSLSRESARTIERSTGSITSRCLREGAHVPPQMSLLVKELKPNSREWRKARLTNNDPKSF